MILPTYRAFGFLEILHTDDGRIHFGRHFTVITTTDFKKIFILPDPKLRRSPIFDEARQLIRDHWGTNNISVSIRQLDHIPRI